MPLLKKSPFVRKPPPHGLKQSDDVFFLPLTNEVFKNYE